VLRILRIVGWLVVLQSVLLGTLVIAVVGGTAVGVRTYVAVFTCVVAGLIPIVAGLTATCSPRTAARMNLCVAPLTPFLMVLFSWEFGGFLQSIAVFSGAILIPGCLWHAAVRHSWPSPLSSSFFSSHRAAAMISAVGVSCLSLAAAFVWSLSLPWWFPLGDCIGFPVIDANGRSNGIDFTASILFIGPKTFRGNSLWSIARVEERFSDSLPGPTGIVFLRGNFKPSDVSDQYFVEGMQSVGALTRFLPVIERMDCGHTGTRERAAAVLRALREGAPKTGVRLIGRVYADKARRRPTPGIQVSIARLKDQPRAPFQPRMLRASMTNPVCRPGQYELHLVTNREMPRARLLVIVIELRAREVGGADFYVKLLS
jgi:hypothetical protein